MRNAFTLTGVAVSIALFVSLTSISNTLKNQLDRSMALCKADIIIQEKGSSTPLSSRIEDGVVKNLKNLSGVRSVASITVGSVKISGMNSILPYLFLFGISSMDPFLSVTEWIGAGIIDGKMFKPGKNEILMGHTAAKRLKIKVGSNLIIGNNKNYQVSGIYWLGQGILDGGAIIDLENSQILLKREGFVNLALIEANNKQDTAHMISRMEIEFPMVNAIPSQSMLGQIRAVTMIDGFISAVSSSAMILGGILILNTLLMAVSERTREIGLLMAVGWSRGMIMRLIIIEALLISFAGGILGYLLAFPSLKILAVLPSTGPGWIPPAPLPGLIFYAAGLAVVIGTISSLYPALRATLMRPAEALRYE